MIWLIVALEMVVIDVLAVWLWRIKRNELGEAIWVHDIEKPIGTIDRVNINDEGMIANGRFYPYDYGSSNIVKHARREMELAGVEDDVRDWLLQVVKAFVSYGHSGSSAFFLTPMLYDLLTMKNLTPLTDNPEEWTYYPPEQWDGTNPIWQNNRNGAAFSRDGGKLYYVLDEWTLGSHPTKFHRTKCVHDGEHDPVQEHFGTIKAPRPRDERGRWVKVNNQD